MRNKLDVIWSAESIQRTDQIIKFLNDKWTNKEIINFLEDLKSFE